MDCRDDCCCVCFERTADRLGPCAHTVCAACAHAWCGVKAQQCPMCRSDVYGLVAGARERGVSPTELLIVPLPAGAHAGVTMRTDAHGVRVSSLVSRDQCARAGLCVGDVVREVNGIPVSGHRQAISLVQASTRAHTDLRLRVVRRADVRAAVRDTSSRAARFLARRSSSRRVYSELSPPDDATVMVV